MSCRRVCKNKRRADEAGVKLSLTSCMQSAGEDFLAGCFYYAKGGRLFCPLVGVDVHHTMLDLRELAFNAVMQGLGDIMRLNQA